MGGCEWRKGGREMKLIHNLNNLIFSVLYLVTK